MQIDNPHEKFLIYEFNNNDILAFLIEYPTGSQKSFEMINSINDYIATDPYTEISIYTQFRALPIPLPHFAIFHNIDLPEYFGVIVTGKQIGRASRRERVSSPV